MNVNLMWFVLGMVPLCLCELCNLKYSAAIFVWLGSMGQSIVLKLYTVVCSIRVRDFQVFSASVHV